MLKNCFGRRWNTIIWACYFGTPFSPSLAKQSIGQLPLPEDTFQFSSKDKRVPHQAHHHFGRFWFTYNSQIKSICLISVSSSLLSGCLQIPLLALLGNIFFPLVEAFSAISDQASSPTTQRQYEILQGTCNMPVFTRKTVALSPTSRPARFLMIPYHLFPQQQTSVKGHHRLFTMD